MKSFLRFNVLFLIFCVFFNAGISGLDLGIRNVLESAKDVTSGVAKDIANKLPTPRGLFDSSKQLIAGYPLEFVMSSINAICKLEIKKGRIPTTL